MARDRNRSFRLQARDFAVLSELSRSDFATRKHLALCCFEGSYEAAKKRLKTLIRSGFISEQRRNPFDAALLRLGSKGAIFLQEEQKSARLPSNLASFRMSHAIREHEIGIRDVRASFIHAIRTRSVIHLSEFQMARSTTAFFVNCDFHRKIETVRPDAFMVVKEPNGAIRDQHFFLEIDCSTESQSHLSHLAKLYMRYFREGGFARKRGKVPLDRAEFPMRVLIIFESRARLANAARNFFKETRVKTLVWFATKEDVLNDPLGAIWNCPVDFQEGKEGTGKRTLFQN